MSDDDKKREEAEEDANEDLELEDEDADKIGGGQIIKYGETTTTTSPDKW